MRSRRLFRRGAFVGAAVLATVSLTAPPAYAVTGYGGWGLVQQTLAHCLWDRAQYKVPSANGSSVLDFNSFGYKESAGSCNHVSPWLAFLANQQGVHAKLWTFSSYIFCSDTGYATIPNGAGSPWGIGRAYNPVGACAGVSLIAEGWATPFNSNWVLESSVAFTP